MLPPYHAQDQKLRHCDPKMREIGAYLSSPQYPLIRKKPNMAS